MDHRELLPNSAPTMIIAGKHEQPVNSHEPNSRCDAECSRLHIEQPSAFTDAVLQFLLAARSTT
jgi:hypothetical protein